MTLLPDETCKALQHFKPALIFFDIDGTLLNTQGNYSHYLVQQLARLKDKGIKLAIASGRPAIATRFLSDHLPITDAGLYCTGAELYDPSRQKTLKLHSLDKKRITDLYDFVCAHQIYCEFYTQDFFTLDPLDQAQQALAQLHGDHLRVSPQYHGVDSLLNSSQAITKLLLGCYEPTQGALLNALPTQFPELDFAFAYFLAKPDWLFASVTSTAADKHRGFEQLIDYHQVSADQVMAFGDSPSDQVFLSLAGMGVAMGNARQAVKDCADIVSLSSDDDGVAQCLRWIALD
ncbi:MAG: HAD hydrolase family protein [Pseudomonadota bacterium]